VARDGSRLGWRQRRAHDAAVTDVSPTVLGLCFVLGGLIAAPFVALGLRSYDPSTIELVVGSAIFGLFPMVILLAGLAEWGHKLRLRRIPSRSILPRARVVRTVRDDG